VAGPSLPELTAVRTGDSQTPEGSSGQKSLSGVSGPCTDAPLKTSEVQAPKD
jgi:hypothetical protein